MTGTTRLESDAVTEIVRVCDVMLDELRSAARVAEKLAFVDGFGDFDSAQQLAAGY